MRFCQKLTKKLAKKSLNHCLLVRLGLYFQLKNIQDVRATGCTEVPKLQVIGFPYVLGVVCGWISTTTTVTHIT
jgi:hypothetical protein